MKLTDIEKYNEAIEFRDWQTCDLIADEHKGLQSKLKEQSETIESMKGLVKELVEALELSSNSGSICSKYSHKVLSKNKELIEKLKGE
jgi:hypothetical protein